MNVRTISNDAGRGARKRTGALGTLAFVLVVILVILSPFPYGGVTPDEERGIVLLAFSAAAIALVSSGDRRLGRLAGALTITLFVFAAFGLLQSIPLPAATVRALSPASASVYESANALLRNSGDTAPLAPSISIARTATIRAVLLILGYAAAFVAAALTLQTRGRRRIAMLALVLGAALHVGWAGITQGDDPRLHGSFTNPNNFAGYLEIVLAVAFALAWSELLTGGDRVSHTTSRTSRWEQRIVRLIPYTIAWAVIAIGIGLTRSRMGITAAVVSMLAMTIAALLHRNANERRLRLALSAGGVLLAAIAITALATRDQPLLRFLATDPRDAESDLRVRIWTFSLDAFQRFPLFGSGLGTFRDAFRQVQPADLIGLIDLAHSDSVQLLVTGGAIGLAIAVAGFAIVLFGLGRLWWRQKHREESVAMLAALGATIAILVHGMADFNLSIPAIPMALAVVIGAGCAAGRGEGVRGSKPAPRE